MWFVICLVGGIYTGRKCPYIAAPVEKHGDRILKEIKILWKQI